jgi:hypothetical protein
MRRVIWRRRPWCCRGVSDLVAAAARGSNTHRCRARATAQRPEQVEDWWRRGADFIGPRQEMAHESFDQTSRRLERQKFLLRTVQDGLVASPDAPRRYDLAAALPLSWKSRNCTTTVIPSPIMLASVPPLRNPSMNPACPA